MAGLVPAMAVSRPPRLTCRHAPGVTGARDGQAPARRPDENSSVANPNTPSSLLEPLRPGAFYGRRIGKALRSTQQDAMTRLLPRYRFTLDEAAAPANLFATPPEALWLEIGFGGGEHLIDHATRRPGTGFLGVEPFINGMARMLVDPGEERTGQHPPVRRRRRAAAGSPARSQPCGADLFYPDPWPKTRHWKRRFVRPDNLDRLMRVLAPGATFRVASDVPDYVGWTLAAIRAHGGFRWTSRHRRRLDHALSRLARHPLRSQGAPGWAHSNLSHLRPNVRARPAGRAGADAP